MSKSAAEARKERLKNRTKRGVKNRGKTGLGRKQMLDYSKCNPKSTVDGKPVIFKMECETGKHRLIDHLPFVITQEWYKDLREKSGEATGLLVGDWDYKLEAPFHKLKGGGYILCLNQAFGKDCAFCNELYAEWDKPKDEQDGEKCKALTTTWRNAYNLYDYDAKEYADEDVDPEMIQLWDDQAYTNYEELLQEMMEVDVDGLATFWDLEQGKTVKYKTRKKKYKGYDYQVVNSIEFVDRDNWEESILDETHSLDQMLHIPTEQEVKEALEKLLGEDDAETKDEEKPSGEEKSESSESPGRQRGRQRQSKNESKSDDDNLFVSGECPAGHEFGVDTNNTPDCDKCDERKYEECSQEFARRTSMEKDDKTEPEKKETETDDSKPKRRQRRQRT